MGWSTREPANHDPSADENPGAAAPASAEGVTPGNPPPAGPGGVMDAAGREQRPRAGWKGVATETESAAIRHADDIEQVVVATLGALLVGVLYLALPDELSLGPHWLLLVIEAVLLAPVVVTTLLERLRLPFRVARIFALSLLSVLTIALTGSVVLLVTHIADLTNGAVLLPPAALLWGMNILVWAVWFWEMDGWGPRMRQRRQHQAADFLFPQQQNGNPTGWVPGFIDYLFVAFCFATALSPADTSPLTRRGKVLMMAEALLSLAIIVVLVARAINIFPALGG